MVSALWKACSEGDLEKVHELLQEATSVDIEIKDHTGATPLIEAVKNGHLEVIRALLNKGADVTNGSSQGRPEQYTSDPLILELLNHTQSKMISGGIPSHDPVYTHDAPDDSEKRYYGPPQIPYYYPSINAPPPPPEGAVYYPPPPPQATGGDPTGTGLGNLPPPEIARLIPCRYFPACRYGSSCIFAHPQGPYFPGPLPPPAQYVPPYDPMGPQPYPPNYYAMPQPSFPPQSNPIHPMAPIPSPSGPHVLHGPSDIASPAQPHFVNPSAPYGQISPATYSHPGQVPVPISAPSLPPVHHHSLPAPPPSQSSSNMYNHTSAPQFAVQQDASNQYQPPPPTNVPVTFREVNGSAQSQLPSSQQDTYVPPPTNRDGPNHARRGTGRRGSFMSRRPTCLFFPSGRCKNGDDCRFPHIMPEGPGPHHPPFPSSRAPRPRHANGNGYAGIEEKFPGMTVRDDQPRQQNVAEGSSRSHSTDPGSRSRFPHGGKNNHVNGVRVDKKPPVTKQRVPNADEFPVLAGSITPPSKISGLNGLPNGNGQHGPTAAQVLQARPPVRKDSAKGSSTRGTTPDPVNKPSGTSKAESMSDSASPHDQSGSQLPVSFAAAATPDISKEVFVSA